MEEDKRKYIENTNGKCLSAGEIVAMVKGDLSTVREKELRKHIDSCVFCREACEGVSVMNNTEDFVKAVKDIHAEVDRKTQKPVIVYKKNQSMLYFAAAAALVFIALASIFIFINPTKINKEIAKAEDLQKVQEAELKSNELMSDIPDQELKDDIVTTKDSEEIVIADIEVEDNAIVEYDVRKPVALQIAEEESREVEYDQAQGGVGGTERNVSQFGLSAGVRQKKASTTNEDELLNQSVTFLKNKNYMSALYNATIVLEHKPDNREAQLIAGICNYHLGNYSVADKQLKRVDKTPSDSLSFESYWFLSNSLIKQNNNDEAEVFLKNLIHEKNHYTEEAEKLLELIK